MSYIGDFRLEDTFDTKFCTVTTTGAPTQLAGSPVISAYPNNSTTQLTAGITLSVDFDSVTGLNNVRVVATNANGYAAGNYQLVITTGTVGGTSVVGYVVAEFSIDARSALRPTTAARTLDVTATGGAGIDWSNVEAPTTSLALTGTTIATTQKVDIETIKTNPVVNAGTITFPTTATLASTTNITAGTITTASAVTTVNGLAANVITAASMAADASGEIADAVWDEAIAGHVSAGSTGEALNAAGAAGDPWVTALPGAYGAGSAGHIIGTALPDIAPGSANGLLRGGTNAATSIATALTANIIGNVTGNLSGSVGSVTGAVGSVTGAVGSVTGNVGGNVVGSVASVTGNVGGNVVGSVGSVTGAVGSVTGAVGSVTGNVGGNVVGSVASVTGNVGGNVTGSVGSVAAGGITATSLASDTITAAKVASDVGVEFADALLKRDLSAVTGEADRSVLNAVRFLRNKWSIAGGTLTVTKEDDSATAWTGAVTQTAGNPVSAIDPA